MSYFFDSSAIVKRCHQEQGSSWVQAVCKKTSRQVLYLSGLAQVEVTAALYRAVRLYHLHVAWAHVTSNQFLRHMRTDYRITTVSQDVLDSATMLSRQYWFPSPLRSLDAIQLACAVVARQTDPGLIFVTADGRLEHIATREGLAVVNPLAP